MTKEHPIIFNAPMVQALLAGRKTQTRRPANSPLRNIQIGDKLWVRETLGLKATINMDTMEIGLAAYYKAGGNIQAFEWNGKSDTESIPSIHMPRWASRITLTVKDVRFQRLQDISEEDAIAEGCKVFDKGYIFEDSEYDKAKLCHSSPEIAFAILWESIYGAGSWHANPEVVALTFDVEVRS